ncbi:MAG: hypothetical protein ABI397_02660 [Candidatus Saccharimonas sp.]
MTMSFTELVTREARLLHIRLADYSWYIIPEDERAAPRWLAAPRPWGGREGSLQDKDPEIGFFVGRTIYLRLKKVRLQLNATTIIPVTDSSQDKLQLELIRGTPITYPSSIETRVTGILHTANTHKPHIVSYDRRNGRIRLGK